MGLDNALGNLWFLHACLPSAAGLLFIPNIAGVKTLPAASESKSLDGIEEKPQLLFYGVKTLPAALETAIKYRNEK